MINIANTFTYYEPKGDQSERYTSIRAGARELATLIEDLCPKSAERTLALRRLQEAMMWANASIAINESPSFSNTETSNQIGGPRSLKENPK